MAMRRAVRQMPASAGRIGEGGGEAASGPVSDEARRPRRELGNTGPDLNSSNRPVRTRMPGGVAGERSITIAPYADRDAFNCL